MAYSSKEKRNAYQRKYYRNHKDKHLALIYKNRERYRKEIREYIVSLKDESCCLLCNEDEPCCLSFHHLRDKKFKIADLSTGYSLQSFKEEIAKCVILCENCHRKVHAKVLTLSSN